MSVLRGCSVAIGYSAPIECDVSGVVRGAKFWGAFSYTDTIQAEPTAIWVKIGDIDNKSTEVKFADDEKWMTTSKRVSIAEHVWLCYTVTPMSDDMLHIRCDVSLNGIPIDKLSINEEILNAAVRDRKCAVEFRELKVKRVRQHNIMKKKFFPAEHGEWLMARVDRMMSTYV